MSLKQNIIYIYFKGKHQVISKSQYQYNRGQYLYFADLNLPQAFEVHFSNKDKGASKTQIGSNNLVEIPDEYFWNGALQIYAWVYLHDGTDDGETIYEVRIPLIKRAKPTDEEPLPVQQSAIDKAIAELNNAVDITNENADKTNADKTQVATIKEEVVTLKEEIDSTASAVSQDAQSARESADASEQSAQNSAEFENNAHNYSDEAKGYAQSAFESKDTASQKAQVATDASAGAKDYRDEAETFKNEAERAKQNIVDYRDETKGYRDETLTAKNDVQTIKDDVQSLKTQIDETATDIGINASDAKSSADLSYQSAISADRSSLSASQFADEASDFADSASQSANQAEEFKNQSATNVTHYPKVVDGYWYVWDASKNEYVNTNVDARGVKGDKGDIGKTGNGIENTVLNSDYTLTITFTDGTSYTTPSIRGEKGIKGDVGNGIASTVLNDDYTLTINFTDGTQYITPPIRGKQGDKGDKGDTGAQGIKGDKGDKGDTGATGAKGDKGDKGDTGAQGIQGEQGIQGIQGEKGEKGDKGDTGEVTTEEFLKAFPTDTASGAIASFSDGADDLPLKSLVVDINPIQDLHGQDSPYPAGGGKNILNNTATSQTVNGITYTVNSDGTVTANGTATTSAKLILGTVTFAEGTYIVNGGVSGNAYVNVATKVNAYATDAQFTVASGGETLTVNIYVSTGATVSNALFKPMIRLASVTDSTFAPYENICPISGWTEVNVKHSDADMTNPTTITIDLGQTVYGGKLDVLTGILTVYPYYDSYNGETLTGEWISDRDKYVSGTTPTIGAQVVNIGAQGVTVQLEPHEVASLLGVNNIWADSGDTTAEYRADPDLYIQKKMPEVPVDDVQINGQSIVTDGVADIPQASTTKMGAVVIGAGLRMNVNTGQLFTPEITLAQVKNGSEGYVSVSPKHQHESAFYGLAKASGDTTQSQSNNTVGTYTDEAKASIKSMLGVQDNMVVNATLVSGTQYTIDSTYDDIKTALSVGKTVVVMSQGIPQPYIGNVQIDSAWYLAFGISTTFNRRAVLTGFVISEAYQNIAIWMEEFADIPDVQIDGTSIVTNSVANIPIASANKVGVVKINAEQGIVINGNQELLINYSSDILVKNGTENYKPLVPSKQHVSTFYGLAKAAGVDMASSSNVVGIYTESAKSAISDMLNGAVQISGTDPTITAKSGIRYVCGEVLSLNFTPSANGICDVMFTSGSTPTVLTLPNTVKMPEWFTVEANTTYEINIADGIYGVVTSWTL